VSVLVRDKQSFHGGSRMNIGRVQHESPQSPKITRGLVVQVDDGLEQDGSEPTSRYRTSVQALFVKACLARRRESRGRRAGIGAREGDGVR
jgi:hypothetical protein